MHKHVRIINDEQRKQDCSTNSTCQLDNLTLNEDLKKWIDNVRYQKFKLHFLVIFSIIMSVDTCSFIVAKLFVFFPYAAIHR